MSERPTIATLLARPIDQRIREFKYRFAQAAVFGLPVLALRVFGEQLSNGREAQRWVLIFSAVLCGWIVFVAAVGMFSDGVMEIVARGRVTPDFIFAVIAISAYLLSFISTASIMLRGVLFVIPPQFHAVASALIIWCVARWWWLQRASATDRVKT